VICYFTVSLTILLKCVQSAVGYNNISRIGRGVLLCSAKTTKYFPQKKCRTYLNHWGNNNSGSIPAKNKRPKYHRNRNALATLKSFILISIVWMTKSLAQRTTSKTEIWLILFYLDKQSVSIS